ncbi:MAG TPA: ArsA-related P-loop ATPase [Anaeromyxobacteraceae bacterium]|nr:ArsA-related P-loop ATPase [Anaeromyxobacteraceae bacterium]
MADPALLDRRLLIVTGKGGVGKSTVSAALALVAARRGKRVLVAEVNAQERVAPLLGAPQAGPAVRQAIPGVSTVNVDPRHALEEYGLMVLRYRALYHAVFENRVVKFFLRMIPSLPETLMLGKILHEARAENAGHPRWDLVVVDAPSTGHAVQLLRVPSALLDTVPGGPMRRDAEWMQRLLTDPARTALSIVAIPEEMPVSETIDLNAQVRDVLRIPRGPLFLNAMPDARFSPEEVRRLEGLREAPPPLGPASRAALLQAERAEQAGRHAARLAEAVDLPAVTLPLLAVDRWGREAVEGIAGALEARV